MNLSESTINALQNFVFLPQAGFMPNGKRAEFADEYTKKELRKDAYRAYAASREAVDLGREIQPGTQEIQTALKLTWVARDSCLWDFLRSMQYDKTHIHFIFPQVEDIDGEGDWKDPQLRIDSDCKCTVLTALNFLANASEEPSAYLRRALLAAVECPQLRLLLADFILGRSVRRIPGTAVFKLLKYGYAYTIWDGPTFINEFGTASASFVTIWLAHKQDQEITFCVFNVTERCTALSGDGGEQWLAAVADFFSETEVHLVTGFFGDIILGLDSFLHQINAQGGRPIFFQEFYDDCGGEVEDNLVAFPLGLLPCCRVTGENQYVGTGIYNLPMWEQMRQVDHYPVADVDELDIRKGDSDWSWIQPLSSVEELWRTVYEHMRPSLARRLVWKYTDIEEAIDVGVVLTGGQMHDIIIPTIDFHSIRMKGPQTPTAGGKAGTESQQNTWGYHYPGTVQLFYNIGKSRPSKASKDNHREKAAVAVWKSRWKRERQDWASSSYPRKWERQDWASSSSRWGSSSSSRWGSSGAPSTGEVGKRQRSAALEGTAAAVALPRVDQELPGADLITVYTKEHEDAPPVEKSARSTRRR